MKKLQYFLLITFALLSARATPREDILFPKSFPTAWVPKMNEVAETILEPAIGSETVQYAFIIKMKKENDRLYFYKDGNWVKMLEAKNVKIVSLGNGQYQIKANGSERVFSYDKDTPTIDRYGGLAVLKQ